MLLRLLVTSSDQFVLAAKLGHRISLHRACSFHCLLFVLVCLLFVLVSSRQLLLLHSGTINIIY